jgi:hypothetical protein
VSAVDAKCSGDRYQCACRGISCQWRVLYRMLSIIVFSSNRSVQYCSNLLGNQLFFLAGLLQFGFLDLPFPTQSCCHCSPSHNPQRRRFSHLQLAQMFKKPLGDVKTSGELPIIPNKSRRPAFHRPWLASPSQIIRQAQTQNARD